MGASSETFSKKEREKARQKKKQGKQEKRDDRKANTNRGQSLDQMLAYVDENGNISSTPPDPRKTKAIIDHQNIQIGVAKQEDEAPEDVVRTGVVTLFNSSKGYGFIRDLQNQQSVFVHQNELIDAIHESDKVVFEVKMTPKGASAIKVKKWVKSAE